MSIKAMFALGALRRAAPQLHRQIELANSYHECFDTPAGQVVVRDLLREAGILSVAPDPAERGFADGKRALALHVLNRLAWGIDELNRRGITFEQLIGQDQGEGAA